MFHAATLDKEKCSGYGVVFGIKSYLHKNSGKDAKNLIILGADLSSSKHNENKKNHVLILGIAAVKINDTTIQLEDKLKTNCTIPYKKFILSVHYNGDNSSLFVNNVQQYRFKAADSQIKANKLYLGGSQENYYYSAHCHVYHSSVDYQPATTNKIQKIHKYSIHKHNTK